MSVGYAIVLTRQSEGRVTVEVTLRQVVWSEGRAAEIVDRLTALAAPGSEPRYSWQAVWVARPLSEPVALTE